MLGYAALVGYFVTLTWSVAVAADTKAPYPTQQTAGRRLLSTAPEVLLGDRLFFETRFAQYFFASGADVNGPLTQGDLIVATVERPGQPALQGPFRGRSMSCRHCHLGDDFAATEPLAQRTYCDFSPRSRIPQRDDGVTQTVRNSPMLVNLGLSHQAPRVLHFDGEFADPEDLILETLVGRNMGWQLQERSTAIAHIARVIREDQGINARHVLNASGNGVPYRDAFLGTDPTLPQHRIIPVQYRLDVGRASDLEVAQTVSRLIQAYLDSIRFGVEDTLRNAGSPYDLFLLRNDLPTVPAAGESDLAYARRLRGLIEGRQHYNWVAPERDGSFRLHVQAYQFGERELNGVKIFLSEFRTRASRQSVGNCIACHTPPQFTDHKLHNTGVSQMEYDNIFGRGAFASVKIPTLTERNKRHEEFLPASIQHPTGTGRFRSAPSTSKPGFADLGAWNIFANPDFPKPQAALMELLCDSQEAARLRCHEQELLRRAVAKFKTPSIRDLGHSQPYFHSGGAETVRTVLRFYRDSSELTRRGGLVNGAPELRAIRIDEAEMAALAAFLESLNEDYH